MQDAHITILAATTGQRLKVVYRASMKVTQLKTAIANQTSIPIIRQIIIYQNIPLSNDRILKEYIALTNQEEEFVMYLFDNLLLGHESQLEKFLCRYEEILQVQIPSQFSVSQQSNLGVSDTTYELGNVQFMLDEHQRIGKEIQNTTQNRYKHASTEINEIQVQDASIRYAMMYFKQYYDRHISKFQESLNNCREKLRSHEELRMRIDQDIEFMETQMLHPDLINRQQEWKYLIDIIGIQNISEIVSEYKSIQLQVQKMTQQGDDDVQALLHMVNQATDRSNFDTLGLDLDLIQQENEQKNLDLAQMQNLVEQLMKDRNEMLERCMSAIGNPQKLAEQLKLFQQLTKQHENILQDLNNRDTQMEDFRKFCRDQKCEALKQLIHIFTHIQSVQNKNRSIEKKMVSLMQLLQREEQSYSSVQRIHEFPFIYMQALADCTRRKIWNTRYQEVARLGQQKLETIRQTQDQVQKQFNQKVERVIGQDLLELMGLNIPPPLNVLQIQNSDDFVQKLVQVDINYLNQVQHQLPAYLQPQLRNYLSSSSYKSMVGPSQSDSTQPESQQESIKHFKSQIQTLEMEKLWLSQRVIEEIVARFEMLMKVGEEPAQQSPEQYTTLIAQIKSMQKTIEQVNQDELKNRLITQLNEKIVQLEQTNHLQAVELQSLRAISSESKRSWEEQTAPATDPQRQAHSSSLGSSHGFLGMSDSLKWSTKSSSPASRVTPKSFTEGYKSAQIEENSGQGQQQFQANLVDQIQQGDQAIEEVFQVVEKPSIDHSPGVQEEGQLVPVGEELSHTSQLTMELKAGKSIDKQSEILQQSFHSAESGSE